MGHKFTLAEVTGGPAALIPAFKSYAQTRKVSIDAAIAVCAGLASAIAFNTLENTIRPQLADAKETYELINGDFASSDDKDVWESGADDVVESVLTEYDKSLSASWLGSMGVDVHMQDDDFVNVYTAGFVTDAWAELIHDSSNKPEDADTRKLSAAKILSACGIVKSDLTPFCDREAVDVITDEDPLGLRLAHAAATKKEAKQMDMNIVYNAVLESGIAESDIKGNLDNACDSDDGLAVGGCMMLGLDLDYRDTLREFVKGHNGDLQAAADELAFMASMGPYEVTTVETVELPAPPVAVAAPPKLPSGLPVPPAPPAFDTSVTLPPPPVLTRPSVAGELPARAIVILRARIKDKDDDMAALVGVSRQTYINYANGKAKLVLSEPQRDALLAKIDEYKEELEEAHSIISNA